MYFANSLIATFENFTLNNINAHDISINQFFKFTSLQNGMISIQNFSILNSRFSDSISVFYIDSNIGSTIKINNVNYSNITTSNKVSLLSLGAIPKINVSNLTFSQVYQQDSVDVTNTMINLESIYSSADSTITLESVTVSNSTISFIKISNNYQSQNINQYITINKFEYSNCDIKKYDTLIQTSSVLSNAVFMMSFSELNFYNISFELGGNLFLLKHQSNEGLIIQNSIFSNISFGKFAINSFDYINYPKNTKVNISNSTFKNIDAYFYSLFELNIGAELTINNSSLSRISNLDIGSIIFVGSKSTAFINNSKIFNNTSIGGIFYAESEGSIRFYFCNIYNNFAVGNAVIKTNENGFFEIYQTMITNNYALYAPICTIFSSQLDSVINNSTISSNIAMSKQAILNNIIPQTLNSFQQYILNNLSLLDQKTGIQAIQIIFGHLRLENFTIINNQDYLINTIGSELTINNVTLQYVSLTTSEFMITESNLT